MKLNFPASSVKLIRSLGGLTVYKRKLNQTAIFFVSNFGTIIHAGGKKHCLRMFNYYRPAFVEKGLHLHRTHGA